MYFVYMKRLLFILSLLIITLAPVSCFYMDEAETVDPGDETFTNPTPPVGGVTTLTAAVSGLTATNPFIVITFSSPVNSASVIYDVNVIVEYPDGVMTLTEGAGANTYIGITNTSKIILDLIDTAPISGTTVRVQLTAGINAESNNSINLTPVNVTRTLP